MDGSWIKLNEPHTEHPIYVQHRFICSVSDHSEAGIVRLGLTGGGDLFVRGCAEELVNEIDAAEETVLRDAEADEAAKYDRIHKRLNPSD